MLAVATKLSVFPPSNLPRPDKIDQANATPFPRRRNAQTKIEVSTGSSPCACGLADFFLHRLRIRQEGRPRRRHDFDLHELRGSSPVLGNSRLWRELLHSLHSQQQLPDGSS